MKPSQARLGLPMIGRLMYPSREKTPKRKDKASSLITLCSLHLLSFLEWESKIMYNMK
jgi:hypothetical protein